jgi:hypothetical protein
MSREMQENRDPLDVRIDAALRTEKQVSVPPGFHARMSRRLRIAALLEREHRAFRRRMVHAAAMAALVSGLASALALYLDVSGSFLRHAPGFLGYLDYFKAATNQVWLASGNPALLLSLVTVVATLLIAGALVELFRQPKHR